MMPSSVALGVPGVQIAPGDHICAFYPSLADRDEILVPYLREGLKTGDKCVCVVDASDPEYILAELGADVDLGPYLGRHQLEVQRSDETYLRDGGFSTEGMLEFWNQSVGGAIAGWVRVHPGGRGDDLGAAADAGRGGTGRLRGPAEPVPAAVPAGDPLPVRAGPVQRRGARRRAQDASEGAARRHGAGQPVLPRARRVPGEPSHDLRRLWTRRPQPDPTPNFATSCPTCRAC